MTFTVSELRRHVTPYIHINCKRSRLIREQWSSMYKIMHLVILYSCRRPTVFNLLYYSHSGTGIDSWCCCVVQYSHCVCVRRIITTHSCMIITSSSQTRMTSLWHYGSCQSPADEHVPVLKYLIKKQYDQYDFRAFIPQGIHTQLIQLLIQQCDDQWHQVTSGEI